MGTSLVDMSKAWEPLWQCLTLSKTLCREKILINFCVDWKVNKILNNLQSKCVCVIITFEQKEKLGKFWEPITVSSRRRRKMMPKTLHAPPPPLSCR